MVDRAGAAAPIHSESGPFRWPLPDVGTYPMRHSAKLASDPSSIVGLPLLEAEWFREFLTLALGIACWSVVGITKLAATNPSSHGRKILAVRIFAGIITITVLIATGITGFFLALALLM